MSSTNYSENFCEAINIVASSIIQGLSFDKTILCTIVNTDNAQKGEYSVSDGSSTFTAMSSNKTYKANTQVYVLIPNGDYTQQKLIVSEYVSGTENEKEDYSFPFETIIPGETIEIEKKDIGLVANERQQENNGHGIKIIDLTNPEHTKYQFNKESIYTRLGIQASFKTFFENFAGEEVYIENGDYSIVISLSGADKDGKAIKDKKYLFNCSDFFGNPYRLDAYTEQSIVFNISEFKKITSIDVQFQESGNFYSINDQTGEKIFFKTAQTTGGENVNNLYVTDLKFIFGFDINEYETNDLLINNLEELNYKNNQKKNLQLNWIRKRTDQSSLISLHGKGMLRPYCKDLWYLWNASKDPNSPYGSNDLEKKIFKDKFTKDISFYWYKYLIKSGVSDKILDEELWTLAAYRNNLNYKNSDFSDIFGEDYLNQIENENVEDNPFKFDFRTSVEHNREKIKMAIVFNGCLRKKTLTLTEGIHIDGTEDGAFEKEVIILKKVEKPYYLSDDDWSKKLKNEFKSGNDVKGNSSIKLVGENACIIKDDTQYNKYIYPYENEVYYTPDVTVDIEDIFNNKDELDTEFKGKNAKDETVIKVVYLDDNNKYINTKINLKNTTKEFILLDWVRQYNKEQIEVTIDETEGSVTIKDPLQYTLSTTPEFLSKKELEAKKNETVKDSDTKVYDNFELVPIKVFKSNEIIYTNTTDSATYNTTNLVENIELNCIDQLKGNYFIYGFDDHAEQDTANRKIQVKFDSVNSEDVDSENIKMAWRIPKELSMIMTPEEFTIEDEYTENFSSVLSDNKVKWIDGDTIVNAIKKDATNAKETYANYWIDNKQSTYKGYWISSQIEVKNSASGKEDSTKEYNFSIPYAINDLYRSTWANNKIYCFIWKKIKGAKDNQVIINKAEKELYFGHLGTNGTKYSFNIRFGCPYNLTLENGVYKSSTKKSDLTQPFLDSNVEDVGVEIIPTLHTGSEALTIDPQKIEWSWHVAPYFKEKRKFKINGEEQEKDITYRTVITHKPSGKCFIRTCRENNYQTGLPSEVSEAEIKNKNLKTSLNFYSKNHCAILKATIEYKSKKLDAYLPIPMRFNTSVGAYSGADKVIYNSLGTEPYYHDTEHMLYSKNNEPFEDSRFEVYIDREKSSTPTDKSYYPYFETGSILTYNKKNYRLYVQPHIFDTIYGYNSSHNKDDGSGKLLRFNTDLTPKTENAETVVYGCKSNGNTLTWYTDAGKADEDKRVGYLYTYDTNILKAPNMFYSENAKTPVSIIGFKTGIIKWGGHEYTLYKSEGYDDRFYGYNENRYDEKTKSWTLLKFYSKDLSYWDAITVYKLSISDETLTWYTKENSTNSEDKRKATLKGRTTCFVQPIFIAQNRFGNTIVNEWDGKLQINEEDNYILSTMMGAGIKETDNSFSGVLMGEVQRSNTKTIGLFGYDKGEESFGFKRDGTAFIGKSGTGRIEFDGTKGVITSSNYINNKRGTHLDLTDGKLISQNDGGTITIDPEKENALFHVKTSNNDDSYKNKTLINIGKDKYYLQSANYASDNKVGMNIDLKNGKLISKNTGGTVTIDPSDPNALFKVINNNDAPLMNIGTNDYYLQSAYYTRRVNGVRINLGTGGFSIASELPEDSANEAGIVISNDDKYLQITKNTSTLTENISLVDKDDESFRKQVDIFVHPHGEELIFRDCASDRFFKVKFAINAATGNDWIPKNLPIINPDNSYDIETYNGNSLTGYQYCIILKPDIYYNLFMKAVKLKNTYTSHEIDIDGENWTYNKVKKILTQKRCPIANTTDFYDREFKLAYFGTPKIKKQISFLETDETFLKDVNDFKDQPIIGHGNSVAYSQTAKSFFVASTNTTFKVDGENQTIPAIIEYKYNTSEQKWYFNPLKLDGIKVSWEIAISKDLNDEKEYLYAVGAMPYNYYDPEGKKNDSIYKTRVGTLLKYEITVDSATKKTVLKKAKSSSLTLYPMPSNIKDVLTRGTLLSEIEKLDDSLSTYLNTLTEEEFKEKKFDEIVTSKGNETFQKTSSISSILKKLVDSDEWQNVTWQDVKKNSKVIDYLSQLAVKKRREQIKTLCTKKNNVSPIEDIPCATFQGMDIFQKDKDSSKYIFLPIVRYPGYGKQYKYYLYVRDQKENDFKKNIEFINVEEKWEIEEVSFVRESNNIYMYMSASALNDPGRLVKIYKIPFTDDYFSSLETNKSISIDLANKNNKIYYSHFTPLETIGGKPIDFAQGFTVGYMNNERVFFYVAKAKRGQDSKRKTQIVVDKISSTSDAVLKLSQSTLLNISNSSFYLKSANYAYTNSSGVGFTGTFFDLNTGKLITSKADITGKITATSGEIGGWEITSADIRNKIDGDNYFLLSGKGFTSGTNTYFIIAKYGGDRKFSVDTNGLLFARDADISGTITATSGSFENCTIKKTCTIGSWEVGNASLYYGTTATFSTNHAFLYPSGKNMTGPGTGNTKKSWVFGAGANFGVTTAGELYATAGKIGNCIIDSSGNLNVPAAHITGVLDANVVKINNLTVSDASIDSLSVNKLTSGTCGKEVKFTNIIASGGQIGGWTIDQNFIKRGNITLGDNTISAVTSKWDVLGVGVKMKSNGTITFQFKGNSDEIVEHSYIGQVGNETDGITGLTFSLGSYYDKEVGRNRHTVFNKGTYGHQFWGSVYFNNGYSGASSSGTNSDLRLKNSIQNLSSNYEILFSHLKPIIYKYNDGTSNRYHSGFIAQDVLTAIQESDLTTQDFAALMIQPVKYNEFNGLPDIYSLRYEEFIALNTHMIQKCLKRIDELENEIKTLKAQS